MSTAPKKTDAATEKEGGKTSVFSIDYLWSRRAKKKKGAKYGEMFRHRSYAERFGWLENLAYFLRYPLSILSIYLASLFLLPALSRFNPFVSLALVLGGMFLLELAKHRLPHQSIVVAYRNGGSQFLRNGGNLILVFVCLCAIVLSVYLSASGVETKYRSEGAVQPKLLSVSGLDASYKNQKNKVSGEIAAQIAQKNKLVADMRTAIKKDKASKANYFRGKFSYTKQLEHVRMQPQITSLLKQVAVLEAQKIDERKRIEGERGKVLNRARAQNSIETAKATKATDFNANILFAIFALVDLALVLLIWYPVHHAWMVKEEETLLSGEEYEHVVINSSEVGNMLGVMKDHFFAGNSNNQPTPKVLPTREQPPATKEQEQIPAYAHTPITMGREYENRHNVQAKAQVAKEEKKPEIKVVEVERVVEVEKVVEVPVEVERVVHKNTVELAQSGYKIKCGCCGKEAVKKSPKAKYCSDVCRKKASRKKSSQPA